MNAEKTTELEELPEPQRAAVQLRQAEEFTMAGHIRDKLRTLRRRHKQTLLDAKQLSGGESADDDMQILARDITINEPAKEATPTSEPNEKVAAVRSRWPLAAALALGLGTPTTAAIVMAPQIIAALRPAAATQVARPEYAPILLPGRPQGVP